MRQILTLLLTGVLLIGSWPLAGIAQELSERQQRIGRLQQELARLQLESKMAVRTSNPSNVPAVPTVIPGFFSTIAVSGLTDPTDSFSDGRQYPTFPAVISLLNSRLIASRWLPLAEFRGHSPPACPLPSIL